MGCCSGDKFDLDEGYDYEYTVCRILTENVVPESYYGYEGHTISHLVRPTGLHLVEVMDWNSLRHPKKVVDEGEKPSFFSDDGDD